MLPALRLMRWASSRRFMGPCWRSTRSRRRCASPKPSSCMPVVCRNRLTPCLFWIRINACRPLWSASSMAASLSYSPHATTISPSSRTGARCSPPTTTSLTCSRPSSSPTRPNASSSAPWCPRKRAAGSAPWAWPAPLRPVVHARLHRHGRRRGRPPGHVPRLDAGLDLTLTVGLTAEGVVELSAELTNTGDDPFTLDSLTPALRVPLRARELLDFTGRHLRERSPQRHPFAVGHGAPRQPPRAHGAAVDHAHDRRRAGVRLPGGAHLGPPRGLVGQPHAPRRACPRRRADPAGGECLARRGRARAGGVLPDARPALLLRRRPRRTQRALPRLAAPPARGAQAGRAASTPHHPQHVGGRLLRARPRQPRRAGRGGGQGRRRAVRARRRVVRVTPRRHRRPRRLGGLRRRSPGGLEPLRTPSAGSAWSSASGSSPR